MGLEAGEVRVAIVGYGLAGATFHAPLIAATPGMRVASIVTSDPGRARRAAREHPAAQVIGDVDGLWASAHEHDLVVVAGANRTHVAVAEAALSAGLGVVVEKPMAPTSSEAYALVESARARGLMLTVFHNRRWDGDLLTVRRLLATGGLGRITRMESRFERWQPEPRPESWRMRPDPADAGGLLFDLGSHLVDQAMLLFDPPLTVYAELASRRPGVAVDDDMFIALEHAGDVRTHLWASSVAALPGPRFRVLGLGGAYVKNGLDGQEDALRAGVRPDDPDFGVEPEERWGRLSAGDGVEPVPTERGEWRGFYPAVVAALRRGAPPPVDAHDAALVIEVLETARAASMAGEVLSFEHRAMRPPSRS